jgi:hypothetical protein
MAVVDGEGNLAQHQHYSKPRPSADLEALKHSEFLSLIATELYKRGSSRSCGPGM